MSGPFVIWVHERGTEFAIKVHPNTSISLVMSRVSDRLGVNIPDLQFQFKDKVLTMDDAIQSVGLIEGDIIRVE